MTRRISSVAIENLRKYTLEAPPQNRHYMVAKLGANSPSASKGYEQMAIYVSQNSPEHNEEILTGPVYLKQNVKIEPLLFGWLAWSHLLSPVQSAMNVSFRYLPLLQSFVTNPNVHVAATRDPTLFGGPFVHLLPEDVPGVRSLIEQTRKSLGPLLQLAIDIKTFDAQLQEGSKGFSFNEVYSKIPQSLSGMVELMYDINNHPRIHFIEELLYAEYGEMLVSNLQVSLSMVRESERRFFMSTPRMKSSENFTIEVPITNSALDELTSMKIQPVPLDALENSLGVANLATRYRDFFTSSAPHRDAPDYSGDHVRVRYFGHACVLVQTAAISVLIDPVFAYEPNDSALKSCARFTVCDLPDKIDYVVLSHCHQDHFSAEMLLGIRPRISKVVIPTNNRGSIVDPSMKLILSQLGFLDVIALGNFDSISFEEGKIMSIPFPGEHSDLDVYSKQSIFLEIKGRKFLFLVDSDGRDVALYQRVSQRISGSSQGKVDALFLGMECHGAPLTWLYGPLLSKSITRRDDESRRLSGSNYERAVGIVREFTCKQVYVYAMGQEPWLKYVMGLEYGADSIQLKESEKLVSHCRGEGMISERLYGSKDIMF